MFFVFQAVYTILANVIDDGFANKVSIDSVIAYGSYIPMIWVFQSVYDMIWQNLFVRKKGIDRVLHMCYNGNTIKK